MPLLPLLAPLLFVLLLWHPRSSPYRPVLQAAVLWGALVVLATELLSLSGSLGAMPLGVLWGAVCLGTGTLLVRRQDPMRPLRHARTRARQLDGAAAGPLGTLVLVGLLYVVVALLILALVAAPNNYDALTYHLPRVFHWIQNESVAHYPTHNPRQVYWGPGAEFAVLHLWTLGSGDRFVSLIQWGAMAGSLVGVGWIARRLGGGRPAQLLAVAFAATIPMGILQSTTTQTDYVTAFWLVCFVAFGLGLSEDREEGMPATLLAGLALGLALLTKGTAYVFGAPFGVWLVWRVFRTRGALVAGRKAGAVLLVALALNVGHYARNIALSGHPLGPSVGRTGILNERVGPDVLVSNFVRNGTLQFASSYQPANDALERAAVEIHERLGLDPSDPETTYVPGGPYRLHSWLVHDAFSGNPLHLVILTAALVGVAFSSRLRRLAGPYALALAAAAILYLLLVRWQIFGSRLQLPWFVAGSPLAGVALERLGWRTGGAIGVVLLVLTVPYIVLNPLKPLVGSPTVFERAREDWYYWHRPDLRPQHERVAEEIADRGCHTVGLVLGGDDMEYPLLLALTSGGRAGSADEGAHGRRIVHYGVTNSTRHAAPIEEPRCVVRTREAASSEDIQGYRKELDEPYLSLWVLLEEPAPPARR